MARISNFQLHLMPKPTQAPKEDLTLTVEDHLKAIAQQYTEQINMLVEKQVNEFEAEAASTRRFLVHQLREHN